MMVDRDTILLLIGAAAPVYCVAFVLVSMWMLKRSHVASQTALTAAFAKTLHDLGSRRQRTADVSRAAAE